eukprot:6924309-Ditylum_brightwellii.AAC.1
MLGSADVPAHACVRWARWLPANAPHCAASSRNRRMCARRCFIGVFMTPCLLHAGGSTAIRTAREEAFALANAANHSSARADGGCRS